MKTSTMGIIVGSSTLMSAGAVKAIKGYQGKKERFKNQKKQFDAVRQMKKSVKTGAEKTSEILKSGIEAETEMIKGGIHKTLEGVKSGIETHQKIMEKEKAVLERMDSAIQKKEMTTGVVVGSTALITTGIVLAFNAYQKKQISKRKFIPDQETQLKKDEIESVDADKAPEYKGLTQLDAQYRDEWQANGFPQTHKELKELGAADGQTAPNNADLSGKFEDMKEQLEKNNAE